MRKLLCILFLVQLILSCNIILGQSLMYEANVFAFSIKDKTIKSCEGCHFFYGNKGFITLPRGGDLSVMSINVKLESKEGEVMLWELTLPKYHNLYLDFVKYESGRHYLGIGGKEFEQNKNFEEINFEEWRRKIDIDSVRRESWLKNNGIDFFLKQEYRLLKMNEYVLKRLPNE